MNDHIKQQITAWALGELDAEEVAALVLQAEQDPEIAEEMRRAQEFCGLLIGSLSTPELALSDRERTRIREAFQGAGGDAGSVKKTLPFWNWAGPLSAAACLCLSAYIFVRHDSFQPLDTVLSRSESPAPVIERSEPASTVFAGQQDLRSRKPKPQAQANPEQNLQQADEVEQAYGGRGGAVLLAPGSSTGDEEFPLPPVTDEIAGLTAPVELIPAQPMPAPAPITPQEQSELDEALDPVAAPAPAPIPAAEPKLLEPPAKDQDEAPPAAMPRGDFPLAPVTPEIRGLTEGPDLLLEKAQAPEPQPAAPAPVDAAVGASRDQAKMKRMESKESAEELSKSEARRRSDAPMAERKEPEASAKMAVATASRSTLAKSVFTPALPDRFRSVAESPRTRIPLTIDTESYRKVRWYLESGARPPRDVVNVQDMINFFPAEPETPANGDALAVSAEMAVAPWNPERILLRVAVRAREIPAAAQAPGRVWIYLDLAESPDSAARAEWIRTCLERFSTVLPERVTLGIAAKGSGNSWILPPTAGSRTEEIRQGIGKIPPSTEPAPASPFADFVARVGSVFPADSTGRILVITDSAEQFEPWPDDRTAVTVVRVGSAPGSERIGGAGLDLALAECLRPVPKLVASGVRLDVECNPVNVAAYRLLAPSPGPFPASSSANAPSAERDMREGETFTAVVELEPASVNALSSSGVAAEPEALRYQTRAARELTAEAGGGELATVTLRYTDSETGNERTQTIPVADLVEGEASPDFRFRMAVGAFALALSEPGFEAGFPWAKIRGLAEQGRGADERGRRADFLRLVEKASELAAPATGGDE